MPRTSPLPADPDRPTADIIDLTTGTTRVFGSAPGPYVLGTKTPARPRTRLCEAAPALLDACRSLDKLLINTANGDPESVGAHVLSVQTRAVWLQARGAIRLATGSV
jgi:hypothetical protein